MTASDPRSQREWTSKIPGLGSSFRLALLIAGLLPVVGADAEEVHPHRAGHSPFVATYDRFGRHGDIPATEAGSLLIAELSCVACHPSKLEALQPKGGPKLDGIGNRVHAAWLEDYLASPHQLKPGSTMPDLLTGLPDERKNEAISSLTTYLLSLEKPFPELRATGTNPVLPQFWDHGDFERGKTLFHQVGCVACHEPRADYEVKGYPVSPLEEMLDDLEPEELEELGLSAAARKVHSVPLPDLAAKYPREALAHFLLAPESTRPAGRMPSFSLPVMQAADLAAYLIPSSKTNQARPKSEAPADAVAEGKKLFRELGCANCHSLPGIEPLPPATPLAKVDLTAARSCLSRPQVQQPDYHLDADQVSAIGTAIRETMSASTPSDQLHFRLLQMNCLACHERDTLGGVGRFRKGYFETVGHVDIGDEGRLPPPLTGVGKKLTTAWMRNVFDGKGNVRGHMTIRMPQFPRALRETLPYLFAKVDGDAKPAKEENVFPTDEGKPMLQAGRQLMDIGCVQCHSFRGEALPGTVGVDLAGIAQRVQPQWFHDFILDPASLKNRTRMPQFFPNGQSQHKDILGGETERQVAAMWHYLKHLEKEPLPAKIEQARAQDYELTPKDRALLLRTFMPVVGTQAIAVGFPEQVHFAFDAEKVALAQAWRGRFIDAEGTWFVRFAPPAEPLGDSIVSFPSGCHLALLPDGLETWAPDKALAPVRFAGYRLDAAGIPTFLYDLGPYRVEDRIVPLEQAGLLRKLRLTRTTSPQEKGQLWLRANTGKSLSPASAIRCTNDSGLAVTLRGLEGGEIGLVDVAEGRSDWLVPLKVGPEIGATTAVELEYRW